MKKLFSRLYWRPYMFIGLSILLVFISSLIPYVLPHAWLAQRYPVSLLYQCLDGRGVMSKFFVLADQLS